MAEIEVERRDRRGPGWIWGLLGLAAIVLIVWWILPGDGGEYEADEVLIPAEIPAVQPSPATSTVTIATVLVAPDRYIGQPFPDGEVMVADVPTDRGFWIEDQGQRLFAVLVDQPAEQPKDINPGQTIRITDAMIRDASALPGLEGEPLDEQTMEIARAQDVFLVVDERNIEVVESAGASADSM